MENAATGIVVKVNYVPLYGYHNIVVKPLRFTKYKFIAFIERSIIKLFYII